MLLALLRWGAGVDAAGAYMPVDQRLFLVLSIVYGEERTLYGAGDALDLEPGFSDSWKEWRGDAVGDITGGGSRPLHTSESEMNDNRSEPATELVKSSYEGTSANGPVLDMLNDDSDMRRDRLPLKVPCWSSPSKFVYCLKSMIGASSS